MQSSLITDMVITDAVITHRQLEVVQGPVVNLPGACISDECVTMTPSVWTVSLMTAPVTPEAPAWQRGGDCVPAMSVSRRVLSSAARGGACSGSAADLKAVRLHVRSRTIRVRFVRCGGLGPGLGHPEIQTWPLRISDDHISDD
jgi:hypothetical protein